MLTRRTFISAATALSAPHVASAQATKVLRFVPRFGLTALDPVSSNDTVTRIAGLMIFESLYSVDDALAPRPQMAEGHSIDFGGRRWTIRLRDGLRFHDGEKVLARDCVASIRRWMQRDLLARGMAPRVDAIEAPDDRTVVFRLNRPFPQLDFALGKPLPNLLPIMPERLAATDPFKPVAEVVGSGPFRFLPDAFLAGSSAAFARFESYQPRDEPPRATSGGRRVMVDRVEWTAIPDPSTAANALLTGEVDWVDAPLIDLQPRLRRSRDVVVDRFDPFGIYAMLRLNHLQGPTANPTIRQAVMAEIDPIPIMQAMTGGNPALYTAPMGLFVPGVPSANTAGMDRLGGRKSNVEVRTMLADAGYRGERLVLLHATDTAFFDTASQIIAAQLSAVGMNVDDVIVDQGTVVQRRNSKAPLDKGGWSMFPNNPSGADHIDPLVALGLRTGKDAWIGWPDSSKMEELRAAWIDSTDDGARHALAAAIQEEGLAVVVYVPLGRYIQLSAWRRNVTGILTSNAPLFWNVRKL